MTYFQDLQPTYTGVESYNPYLLNTMDIPLNLKNHIKNLKNLHWFLAKQILLEVWLECQTHSIQMAWLTMRTSWDLSKVVGREPGFIFLEIDSQN